MIIQANHHNGKVIMATIVCLLFIFLVSVVIHNILIGLTVSRAEFFIEKSHLTRHQKSVHSTGDEKPFACTETKSGCTFRTKRRDKLKDHLARIHGITQVPDNKGLKPSVLKTTKNVKKGGKKNATLPSSDKA